MDTKIDATRTIQVPLAGRISRPLAFAKGKLKILAILALLLIGSSLAYFWWTKKDSAGDYVTEKVSRGSIEVAVNATGTVQAVTTVQVGSQVSGSVLWLGADFKSNVRQGQVIAKLDPALFQAQVNTASANLLNAQAGVQGALTDIVNQTANVEAAKANDRANQAQRDDAIAIAKQNEQLRGVITDREIEAAQNAAKVAIARYSQATSQIGQAEAQLQISKSKLKQAQAAVEQAKAQLEQANVNLQHTIISSPIDGVVVSRSVDVGQTVAASLSAPTLFTIANDLTNMQVLASIDEADVGQVRERSGAHFSVDAFPGQTFNGNITQVRLNAQTLQNVVTYTTVITVSNPDLKLMPGMTANITIPVARRDDVLRVPNSALRFKPDLSDQQQKEVNDKLEAFRKQQQTASANEGQAPEPEKEQQAGSQVQNKNKTPSAGGQKGGGRQGQKGQGQNNNQEGRQPGAKRQQSDNQSGSAGARSGASTQRHQQGANKQAESKQPGGNETPSSGAQSGTGKQRPQQQAQSTNRGGQKPQVKQQQGAKQQKTENQQQAENQTPTAGRRSGSGPPRQVQTIWVLTANKTLEPHFVRTGITDGRVTELVVTDLKEGDVIVIGQTGGSSSNNNRSPQSTTPFGQRPPAAGGGRGR